MPRLQGFETRLLHQLFDAVPDPHQAAGTISQMDCYKEGYRGPVLPGSKIGALQCWVRIRQTMSVQATMRILRPRSIPYPWWPWAC